MVSDKRRLALLAAAATTTAVLMLPSSALGQATRTWVSGVGDDANPCSRTAPCRTWAGAISKTTVNGEIDALDNGVFGAVTITKSITIDGGSAFAGTLAGASNGMIVNLTTPVANDPHQKVVLRNLSINGTGSCGAGCGGNAGLNGIRVDAAKVVRVENVVIANFAQNGIDFRPADTPTRLVVDSTIIRDNTAAGILAAPGTTGASGTANRVTLFQSRIFQNGTSGLHVTDSPGPNKVAINAFRSLFADNGAAGILSTGAESRVRIARNEITGNVTGLQTLNGGQILSWGNNHIAANNVDGAPTGLIGPG